jgi:hypothetical protein
MKRRNIIDHILKRNRKPEDTFSTNEEEAIGYEAFPYKYLEKIIKNYRYSMRFFEKKEKISTSDI